jgi:hypothetical protein
MWYVVIIVGRLVLEKVDKVKRLSSSKCRITLSRKNLSILFSINVSQSITQNKRITPISYSFVIWNSEIIKANTSQSAFYYSARSSKWKYQQLPLEANIVFNVSAFGKPTLPQRSLTVLPIFYITSTERECARTGTSPKDNSNCPFFYKDSSHVFNITVQQIHYRKLRRREKL